MRHRTNEQNKLNSFAILSSSVKIILWSFIHSTTREGESIGMHKEGEEYQGEESFYRIVVARVELYFLIKALHRSL